MVLISSFISQFDRGEFPNLDKFVRYIGPWGHKIPLRLRTHTWLYLTPSNYTIIHHINNDIIRLQLHKMVRIYFDR